MKMPKFLNIFKKRSNQNYNSVSGFFLRAPKEEKEKVFKEAARMANEDQRELLRRTGYRQ